MTNYLIHVPVGRIIDVFNMLKRYGEAELYDFKLITIRTEFGLDALRSIIGGIKPDMPVIVAEVINYTAQGDDKVQRAVKVWGPPPVPDTGIGEA
jgi:hypothetical protein